MNTRNTMLAGVYLGAGKIETVKNPLPEAGPDDVVIQVKRAGICGTDTHSYRHGIDYLAEGLTIGHEFSGQIASVGSNVKGLRPGMRVTANPMVDYLGLFTDLAFAQYLRIPNARLGENVFEVPEAVSDTEAALAEPLAVALRGLNHCSLSPDSNVLIQGLGPIGLCALLVARQRK